jgi:hypothetical protein
MLVHYQIIKNVPEFCLVFVRYFVWIVFQYFDMYFSLNFVSYFCPVFILFSLYHLFCTRVKRKMSLDMKINIKYVC